MRNRMRGSERRSDARNTSMRGNECYVRLLVEMLHVECAEEREAEEEEEEEEEGGGVRVSDRRVAWTPRRVMRRLFRLLCPVDKERVGSCQVD